MKGLKELKEKLNEDISFKELFLNAQNIDEFVDIAKSRGFEVNSEDVDQDDELSNDMLEAVAGGKRKSKDEDDTHIINHYYIEWLFRTKWRDIHGKNERSREI